MVGFYKKAGMQSEAVEENGAIRPDGSPDFGVAYYLRRTKTVAQQ